MSIVDRINYQAMQMGAGAKAGFQSVLLAFAKILSGALVGLTFTLVGTEIFDYGPIMFWFVLIVFTLSFYRLSKSWSFIGLFIFDLLCILAALLIRMYIVVAPG